MKSIFKTPFKTQPKKSIEVSLRRQCSPRSFASAFVRGSAIGLCFALVSCSGGASQCKQLINLINDAQGFRQEYEAAIERSRSQISGAKNLAETQSAAEEFMKAFDRASQNTTALTEEISALDITDEQLLEYRNSFATATAQWTLGLEMAKEAKNLLVRAESEEDFREYFDRYQQGINGAYSTIQSAEPQIAASIDGINAYCVPTSE